jgi:thiamine biosynthesis protein ThiS
MRVKVNGEERTLDEGVTLAALITGLGLNAGPIVVQRNGDIVERARLDQVSLNDGDQVELVRFVGGG